jgi:integration host factor subunit beta
MTKSDLIDVLCETQKMPKGRAELLVNVIFDSMEASLKRGERIEIRGFGSFEIREYRSYEGRNPRTGEAVAVKPKRLPFFKVGKELKERVNAGARRGAKAAPAESVAAQQAQSSQSSQASDDVETSTTRVSA